MLNIETKELKINDKLKRKIEMIGRFTNTTPIIMFDECDEVYVNTFKSKISFKDLEGKSYKKITNIYNKENILGKTWRDLIRIIPIKDNDKFKSNKLELKIITINLSNITSPDGTQLHKNIFKTSKVTT